MDLGYSAITLNQGASISITPQTLNFLGNNQSFETSGYSCLVSDVRLLNTFNGLGINTQAATDANAGASSAITTTIGTDVSKTVIGTQFNLRATTINTLFAPSNTSINGTLTFVGLDSGARLTIPITINYTT